MKRFKAWVKRTWSRFKLWALGVLASIGLVSVALVQPLTLSYTPPTQYTDGSPLPIEELAEARLYCSGSLVITETDINGTFDNVDAVLTVGDHTCYATVVAINGIESDPSNSLDVTVLSSSAPEPPVLSE